MAAPGVVYKHTVASFFTNVVARGGLLANADYVKALRGHGVDPTRPADTGLETWMAVLELTAAQLNPGAPREDAMRDIGMRVFKGMSESVVGMGMVLVMRLLGPRRALLQIMDSYRSADNITQVTVKELAPNHLQLAFNTVGGAPTYVEGLFFGLMKVMNIKDGAVTFVTSPDGGAVFDVRWP